MSYTPHTCSCSELTRIAHLSVNLCPMTTHSRSMRFWKPFTVRQYGSTRHWTRLEIHPLRSRPVCSESICTTHVTLITKPWTLTQQRIVNNCSLGNEYAGTTNLVRQQSLPYLSSCHWPVVPPSDILPQCLATWCFLRLYTRLCRSPIHPLRLLKC